MSQCALARFGKKLSSLRQSQGVTRTHLAQRANITPLTLHFWENGTHLPHPVSLRLALDALQVSPKARDEIYQLIREADATREIPRLSFSVPPGKTEASEMYDTSLLWSGLLRRSPVTSAEIMKSLGVSAENVSRWRRGRRLPPKCLQPRLMELLEVPEGTRHYLSHGTPPKFLEDVNTDDASALRECADRLRGMVAEGLLGDEADCYFFAIEERLFEHVQNGNKEAALHLAIALTHHSDWRGRHGYPNRQCITRAGLHFAPLTSERGARRQMGLGLALQQANTTEDRKEAIARLKMIIRLIANAGYPEEKGLHASALSSLGNFLSQSRESCDQDLGLRCIEKALEIAHRNADRTGFAGYIVSAQHRRAEALLRQSRAAQALLVMPDARADDGGRDHYGMASRLLLHSNVYIRLGERNEARNAFTEASSRILTFRLDSLLPRLKSLEARI